MNRLALITLAAGALVPLGAANAQTTVQPPLKSEDVPNARLRVPATQAPAARPAPGVSWQAAPAAPAPQVRTRVMPAPPHAAPQVRTQVAPAPRPAPRVQVAPAPHAGPVRPVQVEMRRHGAAPHHRPEGPVRVDMRRGDGHVPVAGMPPHEIHRDVVIRRGGDRLVRRHHGINRYPGYRRIDRGLALPQYWWGPRFHVMNWGRYGLPQPIHGGRWVRYYDDALLVDGYGRVHDGRWGMDWNEYPDQWDYDDRGIPGYGGYHPDDRDYRWPEGHRGPPAPYVYGHYQQAYGYPGHGYGGGMVVTETTVTTSPTVITETVYEDVVHSAPKRHRGKVKGRRISAKARCHC